MYRHKKKSGKCTSENKERKIEKVDPANGNLCLFSQLGSGTKLTKREFNQFSESYSKKKLSILKKKTSSEQINLKPISIKNSNLKLLQNYNKLP